MTVRVTSRTVTKGTATPSGLNTETNTANIVAQAEIYTVEGYIDLGNLQSGDVLVVKEYISVDDVTAYQYKTYTYNGAQTDRILRFHSKLTQGPYKVTVEQTSGTIRGIGYWFNRMQLEVV